MRCYKTNPKVEDHGYEFIPHLKVTQLIKKYNHRVTFHPGQFNVLGTPHKRTLEMTIKILIITPLFLIYLKLEKTL